VLVRTWNKALLGALLVGAVAVAGIALNFTLLRLTQDSHDPVGKLSPRAVFAQTTRTGTTETRPPREVTTPRDDRHGSDHDNDD
jgi:hypothetical protein